MYLTKTPALKQNLCFSGLLIVFVFPSSLMIQQNSATINTTERGRVRPSNSCYYLRDLFDFKDASKLYLERETNKLIFFLETSCRTTFGAEDKLLKPRQACAIESAARVNPNYKVYVLFTTPGPQLIRLRHGQLSTHDSVVDSLLEYPNVNFARIYFDTYSSGTPLESWFKANDTLRTSKYQTEQTSDALRMLTLWKFGGIYLDMDVVVTKSLHTLGMNWAGRQTISTCANGVMSFSRDKQGRMFTDAALREISKNFRGNNRTYIGPLLVDRVLKELCSDHKLPGNTPEDRCHGFRALDPDYFYPIPYGEWKLYFEQKGMERIKETKNVTYLYHVWNYLSSQRPTQANSTVPYTYLANKYCPKVYALTKDYF